MELSGQLHSSAAFPWDGTPLPTEQEAGWGPEPVRTLWRREKPFTLADIKAQVYLM